ncbi:hypothetical protein, partial [Polaromonas sp.]|uniref:hypothetical protein n=1 Tax=Polaromonas sp. TaxID=1869339 RepID=UPI002C125A4B
MIVWRHVRRSPPSWQSRISRPRLRKNGRLGYDEPMQFDLTDLRLFVLTAEQGNLTRAAAG